MEAFCATCDSVQDVERAGEEESNSDVVYCLACGDEFSLSQKQTHTQTEEDKYRHYKIARIVKVEPVPKSKDLKLCQVDVTGDGKEENLLQIVTNAKYCEAGWKVVVACIGAVIPAGAVVGETPDAVEVSKRSVQGVVSHGVLCDSPTLRWTGGAKGIIQQLPDTDAFVIGERPPESRPRM